VSRYDGIAEWYDAEQTRISTRSDAPLAEIASVLGPGHGLVVELGCGTGLSAQAIRSAGWSVGGLDLSLDQLRLARHRCRWVVRADAAILPFRSSSIGRVAMVFVHTDVDDFATVVRELARVLGPGGVFAFVGVHPCFVGPHVESVTRREEFVTITPGYRKGGWTETSANFGPGIRSRVGARHVPLAELVMAIVDAGLVIESFVERGDGITPWMLGVRARKP
jgi:SAM-dependent methyltransferase